MHGTPSKRARPPTIDGIVGEHAVAVQFLEIGEQRADVIQRVGPLRVTRHLRDLPGGELGVDLLGQRLAFLLQALDFLGNVDRRIVLHEAQFLDRCSSSAIGCSKSRNVVFIARAF